MKLCCYKIQERRLIPLVYVCNDTRLHSFSITLGVTLSYTPENLLTYTSDTQVKANFKMYTNPANSTNHTFCVCYKSVNM